MGGLAHAADPPTATFTAIGLAPVACGSRPDVDDLAVSEGTAVVIANHTGVPAKVVVAGQTVLTIDSGTAGSLTLAAGSHQVTLVPQCVVVAHTFPLAVTVTPASSPPPESPVEDPPPALGPAAPGGSTGEGEAGREGPAPKRAPSGGVPLTSADPGSPSASASPSRRPAPGPSSVVQAEAIPWTKPEDPKGVRLLAVIATICVLGVTAAIIRSIVRLDAERRPG